MPTRARRRLRDVTDVLQAIVTHADLLADSLPAGDPRRADVDAIRELAHQAAAMVVETGQLVPRAEDGAGARALADSFTKPVRSPARRGRSARAR